MFARKGLITFGLVLLMLGSGCGTIAKRGFKEFRGAESQLIPITDLPAYELLLHSKVELGEIRSDIGHVVPQEFIDQLTVAIRQALASLEGLKGQGPVLKLSGRITFFQAGGGVGALLGKEKMSILHVTFESAGASPKGECLLVARSEAVRTGRKDLAREIAKRLAKYLQAKLPH